MATLTVYNGTDKDAKDGILGHLFLELHATPTFDKAIVMQHLGFSLATTVNEVKNLSSTL